MPRTRSLMFFTLERSRGKTGESLSDTGSCSLRSIPAPWCFCFKPHLRTCLGWKVNSEKYKVAALRVNRRRLKSVTLQPDEPGDSSKILFPALRVQSDRPLKI